jgi:hypothetical protein
VLTSVGQAGFAKPDEGCRLLIQLSKILVDARRFPVAGLRLRIIAEPVIRKAEAVPGDARAEPVTDLVV